MVNRRNRLTDRRICCTCSAQLRVDIGQVPATSTRRIMEAREREPLRLIGRDDAAVDESERRGGVKIRVLAPVNAFMPRVFVAVSISPSAEINHTVPMLTDMPIDNRRWNASSVGEAFVHTAAYFLHPDPRVIMNGR